MRCTGLVALTGGQPFLRGSMMTPEQATQMIDLLTTISTRLEVLEFLVTSLAVGVGILWGAFQWHLIIQAKNQSSLF